MSGCNECKHHRSELGEFDYDKGSHGESTRACALGYNEKVTKWWLDNGNKFHGDKLDDMKCHEDYESTKILQDMNEKFDELIKKLTIKK